MMVPVSLRGTDSAGELGNRISLVPVTIPLDIRNPRKLVTAVHERTEFLKRSHAAELVRLAGGLIGMFPSAVQGLAGQMLSQLPITPFNLVCTNVPGPQFPLYLRGHKMLRWYPYVPVGGEMAVNCAILSYDGNVYFGFSGDVQAAPDLRRLEAFVKLGFEELRKAARIGPPQTKKASAKETSVKEKTAAKSAPVETARAPIRLPANLPLPESKREPKVQPLTEQEKITRIPLSLRSQGCGERPW